MKILGIDTSSKFLNLALSENDSIIIEESKLLDRLHSSLLIPSIKDMLDKANTSIEKIDAFFIGIGPGSFTGLRIGVSTVKGFGVATGKPCIGVPSIDAIAMNVDIENKDIITIIDAKRSLLYSAVYRKKNNLLKVCLKPMLLSIDEAIKKTKEGNIFLGDGLALYKDKISHTKKNIIFMDEGYWYPKAGNIIRLGIKNLKKNKEQDLSKLDPIYLYPKDCQVKKHK